MPRGNRQTPDTSGRLFGDGMDELADLPVLKPTDQMDEKVGQQQQRREQHAEDDAYDGEDRSVDDRLQETRKTSFRVSVARPFRTLTPAGEYR
jgi:hypothetical protein